VSSVPVGMDEAVPSLLFSFNILLSFRLLYATQTTTETNHKGKGKAYRKERVCSKN
jgi:hypothetical protein